MEKVTYKVSLDMKKNNLHKVLLGAIKGENNSRRLEVTLSEKGKPYNCSNTAYAVMYVLKPGQKTPSVNFAAIDKNVIKYDILGSDLDTPGAVRFQLKLIDSVNGVAETLITVYFELEVDDSIVDDSLVPAQPTYSILDKLIAENIVLKQEVTERIERVDSIIEDSGKLLEEFADHVQDIQDTAIEAMEVKKEQTIASIPSDYSTLSVKVEGDLPALARLIAQCKPSAFCGNMVVSKNTKII